MELRLVGQSCIAEFELHGWCVRLLEPELQSEYLEGLQHSVVRPNQNRAARPGSNVELEKLRGGNGAGLTNADEILGQRLLVVGRSSAIAHRKVVRDNTARGRDPLKQITEMSRNFKGKAGEQNQRFSQI